MFEREFSSQSLRVTLCRQYLLAGRGFDADKISQTIHSIKVAQAFEPLQPLEDTDVEGFLRHEHELTIISAIEATRNEVGYLSTARSLFLPLSMVT